MVGTPFSLETLDSIYASHVGIVVRVGKLVRVRMGKVWGRIFGMMVWISRRVPQRLQGQSRLTLP